LIREVNCLNWPGREEGKVEGRPGAARIAVAPGRQSSGERKKKGKGRGEADKRGSEVSIRGEKKKKKKKTGGDRWAAGPPGRRAEKVRR
jgi:hypothetical protein